MTHTTTQPPAVTQREALDFLGEAFRNVDLPSIGGGELSDIIGALQTFATRHRLAERERCAKVAEGFEDPTRDWLSRSVWDSIKRDTARRIREAHDDQ